MREEDEGQTQGYFSEMVPVDPSSSGAAEDFDDDPTRVAARPRLPPPRVTMVAGPEAVGVLAGAPGEPATESPQDEDRTGQVLSGRYRLLERAARGGSGYVYRAQHVTIGKQVAVKILHRRLISNELQVERFLREAKAAARISHDNVIELIDYGETEDSAVYVVMEWLEGEDLGETLSREGAFTWKRTKQIALQICRALHAAHSRNILHRDLKPENCFRIKRRSNRDFIKLLDFGLAKVFGDETKPERSLTKTGNLFGTPEYMSPEQAQGVTPDHRTDVYSLGVMLYEMLTGSVPFDADNYVGVLVKHASERPDPPSRRAPEMGITPALDGLVMRALAKDPEDRYADIREFAQAIASLPVTDGDGGMSRLGAAAVDEVMRERVRFLERIVLALVGAVVVLTLALLLSVLL